MADTFVKMVEFRSTGLDKIETGLKRAVVTSESAITAGKAYQKVLDNTLRTMPSMVRIFEAGVRVQKEQARTLTEVARAQERVNLASPKGGGGLRFGGGSVGGALRAAVGPAATIAGGVAAGGFAMGLSGMSGTVPMARFQNQMDRVSWELGNTLTPTINKATTGLAKFANWLSGLSTGQQEVLGGGLAIGAGALGAQVLSRQVFGKGIGGAASSGYEGLSRLGGYSSGAGPTPSEIAYRAQYGSQGLNPGSMSEGMTKSGGAARGASRGLMAIAAIDTFVELGKLATGNQPSQRYARGELTQNEVNPLAAEYEKKFQGMRGEDFKSAVQKEIGDQEKNRRGEQFSRRPWWNPTAPGELESAQAEATKRKTYLEGALKTGNLPGGTADHTANQIVGGDFQEIGSGYYGAASAYAKAGGDQAAAGGGSGFGALEGMVQQMLEVVRDAAAKQANPLK